jgi:hypothetical protein
VKYWNPSWPLGTRCSTIAVAVCAASSPMMERNKRRDVTAHCSGLPGRSSWHPVEHDRRWPRGLHLDVLGPDHQEPLAVRCHVPEPPLTGRKRIDSKERFFTAPTSNALPWPLTSAAISVEFGAGDM